MNTVLELKTLTPLNALDGGSEGVPQKTAKPWGHELLWAVNDHYAAKILHIEAGRRLSLQYHRFKHETLLVVSGRLEVELERGSGWMERFVALPGHVFDIPAGRKHRLAALETCEVLETSTAELDDLIRLQDDYGRD